jgi:hypothetical protein
MGEDTSCNQIPDPRNGLGILRSLDFQRDTEYLGEIASVCEAARLADGQAACQHLSEVLYGDLLIQLVHYLLVA